MPTFEVWEQRDLAEMLRGAVAVVAEDQEGNFLGLLRLYKIGPRDGIAYVESQVAPESDTRAKLEAFIALIDYAFGYHNLRKLYVEIPAEDQGAGHLPPELGFEEELRLREHTWFDGRYLDIVYLSLPRERWLANRPALLASKDLSFRIGPAIETA